MKISNRTFVVSGGSSGLGLASVQMLHDEGGFICVLDINEPSTEWKHPQRVKYLKCDIGNVEEIEEAVTGTMNWIEDTGALLGGIVNCAGVPVAAKIADPSSGPHSLGLWNFVLGINLTGTFNLSRLFGQHLLKVPPVGEDGERGVIILVASSAAFEGQTGQTAYAATKGAIRSMTLPMARDLGSHASDKVRASLQREQVFPMRFGKAHEFAQTVKWILECTVVNGDTFRLSAGSRMPARM